MSDYEQRYPGTDVRRVEIDRHDGDVTVRWSARDDVLVGGEQAADVEVDGDTLTIKGDVEFGRRGSFNRSSLRVELPETVQETRIRVRNGDVELAQARGGIDARVDHGDLEIKGGRGELAAKLGAGDVKVETYAGPVALASGTGDVGMNDIEGPVTIQTGNGDVTLRGGRGDVAVQTARGDLLIRDRDAASAEVKTGAGDVSLNGGTIESVAVQTGMGDVQCRAGLGPGNHEFTTGAGDIAVAVPRDLSARIDATTVSGSIDSEVPLVAVGKRGPKSVLGRRLVGGIGESGARAEIRIRSVRGDVSITWLNGVSGTPSAPAGNWRGADDLNLDLDADVERDDDMSMRAIPVPPPAPPAPGAPEAPRPDLQPDTGTPERASDVAGEERAILSALAAGTLSIAEAERLLDALARRGSAS